MPNNNRRRAVERPLTDEDRELWYRVAKTAVAWRKDSLETIRPPVIPEEESPGPSEPPAERAAPPRQASGKTISGLDTNTRRKLSRGARTVDGRLDLHGMRQNEAHKALRRFLANAQSRGCSFVIVITGKGATRKDSNDTFDRPGVLRQTVPHWLRTPEMQPFVVAFGEAARRHGGEGALYVQIRKQRRRDSFD